MDISQALQELGATEEALPDQHRAEMDEKGYTVLPGVMDGQWRADVRADPRLARRALLENGYAELPITGAHAVAVDLLPPIHGDRFDRMLVAQAQIEAMTLLTADEVVGRYPGPVS